MNRGCILYYWYLTINTGKIRSIWSKYKLELFNGNWSYSYDLKKVFDTYQRMRASRTSWAGTSHKRLASLLAIFMPYGLKVCDIWYLDIIELNTIPYWYSIDYDCITHATLYSLANRMWYRLQYENNQQQWPVRAFFRSSSSGGERKTYRIDNVDFLPHKREDLPCTIW